MMSIHPGIKSSSSIPSGSSAIRNSCCGYLRFSRAYLAVLFTYLIGARLYTKMEGLTASAVMSVSWAPIFYSQEARAYTLVLVATSAAFFFWYEILRRLGRSEAPSPWLVIAYLSFAVISCYLHYFGLLFVVLQAGYGILVFLSKPQILRQWLLFTGVIFISYLPWIPSMIAQFAAHREFWIEEPSLFEIHGLFWDFAYKVRTGLLAAVVIPAYLVFLATECLTILGVWRKGRSLRDIAISPTALLVLWVVAPFAASYVQSKVSTPVMTTRNLIILLPPMYLILARGVWTMQRKGLAIAWTSILVLSLLYALIYEQAYYAESQKQQFREAAAFVIETDGTNVTLPLVAHTFNKRYFEYYLEKMRSPKEVDLLAGEGEDIHALEDLLKSTQAEGFWFLWGHIEPHRVFLDYLENHYVIEKQGLFRGTGALKIRRIQPPPI